MRRDGLVPGMPFFIIQLFDSEGYYSCCVGTTLETVQDEAARRSLLSLVLFSVPFSGAWKGGIPVVTAPWEIQALAKTSAQAGINRLNSD